VRRTTNKNNADRSCYLTIDWKIREDEKVKEAIKKMVANNVGALAVVDSYGTITGIVSERDYLNKVSEEAGNQMKREQTRKQTK